MKETVNFDYIWMPKKTLDFQLPDELFEKPIIYDLPFLDHLHREDEPSVFLFNEEDFPKFSFSQFLIKLEALLF